MYELWREVALGWGRVPLTLKVFSSLGIALLLIYLAASDQYYGREIWFVLCVLRSDTLCWLRRASRDGSCRLVIQNGTGAPETTAG